MVGAHQPSDRATLGGTDSRAPMPAGVMKRIEAAVAVAHHYDRILADLHGQVVSRIRDLAIMPDEEPVPIPDHLEIDLVLFGAAIKFTLQRGFVLSAAQSAQHRGA